MNSEDEYALTEFQLELLRAVTPAEVMKSPQTSDFRNLRTLLKVGQVTTRGITVAPRRNSFIRIQPSAFP